MSMHVVLAGGGTAGHIEPALALADALRRDDPDVGITALGTERGAETRLVPARGYDLALIPPVPLPRRPTLALFAVPARLIAAVRAASAVLDRTHADVVAGFGGYVALPAYLAARRRHIPFVVHEANARPGLANRIGARLTPYVATATSQIALPHATHIGIPLRAEVATLDRAAMRDEARREFGLTADAPTVLVFGGSQGARRLNDAVVSAAAGLLANGIQVLHATGPEHEASVRDATRAQTSEVVPYVVCGYIEHMERAYAAADLVVCRAGAMTCAELAAVGLPAVYVPLPHGNGEQRLNALPVVEAGGGLLVDDEALTGDRLLDITRSLLGDGDALATMSVAAARFGRRDADVALARLVRAAATRR
jgi:UDP-N-acetylglucosamine--N-acetylmuramyl-(pentapeptide) pyrophosphoryl-undecaprenol N-acetylglucosamine transferase